MSDEHVTYQPNEEPDTVPQNPGVTAAKAPGQWVMPEPVFRKTSGVLPQGFAERYAHLAALDEPTEEPTANGDAPAEGAAPPISAATTASPPAAAPLVEAQPDISELVAEEPAVQAAAEPQKEKSSAARLVLSLLGLAGAVLFIAVFLAVVYFLFLAPAEGGYSPF